MMRRTLSSIITCRKRASGKLALPASDRSSSAIAIQSATIALIGAREEWSFNMTDEEFSAYVLVYVKRYTDADEFTLEIIDEALAHARGIEREVISRQKMLEERKDIHPVCHH